jgi:hypothetical protein
MISTMQHASADSKVWLAGVVQTLPVAPCPAGGGGLLCFGGDVLGWLGQFLLGLALLLPDACFLVPVKQLCCDF